MKFLVIGNGGREHAICWKLAQSPEVKKIYCAVGNGGTFIEDKCENVNLTSINEYIDFVKKNDIDITFVGPEAPLVEGIADEFKKQGLKIFGPSEKAAQLEGSKAFSKDFMKKYNVKTAEYEVFEDESSALEYIKNCSYPVVIKADGLAAGKGVVICSDKDEAEKTINSFMIEDVFKGSGKKIVIEEFLEGVEASILSITDGETIIPFISAKDHKTIYENNEGPNTGGMGVIAPNPYCTEKVLMEFKDNIMLQTIKGIKEEKMDYIGIIFFGLMITKKGVYLLEYNVRMGDPETQAVLSLMESDFAKLIDCALNKSLESFDIRWKSGFSCCVVGAAKGYPGSYEKWKTISIKDMGNNKLFIAGANFNGKELKTSGGRVLSVTAVGETLDEARENAYSALKNVSFEGMIFRKDIGKIN